MLLENTFMEILCEEDPVYLVKCHICARDPRWKDDNVFIADKLKQENYSTEFICPHEHHELWQLSYSESGSSFKEKLKCGRCYHTFYATEDKNSAYAMCGCCGPYPYCPKCDCGSC